MNDLLLRACRRQPVPRPPVWIMRQAGRYLPQYQALRARHDFLTLVNTPDLAVQVSLQPVDLLGVDAAIVFSDILIVPAAMGMSLTFEEGAGPVLHDPIRQSADIDRLRDFAPEDALRPLVETLRLLRSELEERVPLIGFAGGPWTLATYMVEGGGGKEYRYIKRLIAESPAEAHRLLGRLSEVVGRTLVAQAEAGAQVLQVFESAAASVGPSEFDEFVLPYLARTVRAARSTGVPVIAFAPGAGWALSRIARDTDADVVGVDWRTTPAEARSRLVDSDVACQGNLDPGWLYAPREVIRERTREMIAAFGGEGYIANLGHGIFRDTPVDHAQEFVNTVQEWSRTDA